jgi:hypothetical protein
MDPQYLRNEIKKEVIAMKVLNRFILTITIIFALFTLTLQPSSASSPIPEEAQRVAEEQFLKVVMEIFEENEQELYGFAEKPGDISFGPLHPTYTFSERFVLESSSSIGMDESIIPTNEYISVIYQNKNPVNVIGVFKNEDFKYEFSTIGHQSLAAYLDQMPSDGQLIYEMPTDAWYYHKDNVIQPVNDSSKSLMTGPMSINSFRSDIHDRYEGSQELPDDAVGGSEDKNKTIINSFLLGFVVFGLVVFTPFVIRINRNES